MSPNAQPNRSSLAVAELPALELEDDLRWIVARHAVAGSHFARSPLLSRFLLYIVEETIAGRQGAISEHKIGVAVFGRPASYRTDDDNIVRNYARQLRKRLSEHFDGGGRDLPLRIEIPLGGYVPYFIEPKRAEDDKSQNLRAKPVPVARLEQSHMEAPGPCCETKQPSALGEGRTHRQHSVLIAAVSLLAGIVLCLALASPVRNLFRSAEADPSGPLWRSMFSGITTTYVVPPDAGFNLMEDISRRSMPLADYINGSYQRAPLPIADSHSVDDLHTQQYTDFVSVQIMTALAQLAEYDPHRVLLRFPRDLRIDDLKNSNAIIIGSASSNPWAALGDSNTNFRIVPGSDMQGASIANAHPRAGEQSVYVSHWSEPAHETYALILFQPNLRGTGSLLLIEGLDVAGTQAAAEVLFHSASITPVLEKARTSANGLRPFEILLRATSIQSDAEGPQIIAYRVG